VLQKRTIDKNYSFAFSCLFGYIKIKL